MIYEDIERAFAWTDADNNQAQDNLTVQGFLEVINNIFYISTPTYVCLEERLESVPIDTAVENGWLNEPIMDLIAEQMRFSAWDYVGKFNLIAPFDTVLKRKKEMLKWLRRLMRFRGTAWAIEQVLLAFGFSSIIIHENVVLNLLYDGTYDYDGAISYSGTLKHQLFSVELTTTLDLITPGNPDEQIDAIVSIVNNFKKFRPELYQVVAHTPTVPTGDTRQIWGA